MKDFNSYNQWCKANNLAPSHAINLHTYMSKHTQLDFSEMDLFEVCDYLRSNYLTLNDINASALNAEAYADLIDYSFWAKKYDLPFTTDTLYLYLCKDDMGFWFDELSEAIEAGLISDKEMRALREE